VATCRFSGILTQSPQFGERPPQGAAGGSGQRGPQRRLRGPLRAASRDGGGGNAVGEGSGADSGEAAAGPAAMGSEYGSAGDRAAGRTRPVGAVGERSAVRLSPHGLAGGRAPLLTPEGRTWRRAGSCGARGVVRGAVSTGGVGPGGVRGDKRGVSTRGGFSAVRGAASPKGTAADGCEEPHVAGWERCVRFGRETTCPCFGLLGFS